MPRLPWLAAFGLLATLAACAGPRDPARGSPFPSKAKLEALTERAPPLEALHTRRPAPVSHWTLTGPFPDRIGEEPVEGSEPWDAVLQDAARRRAGLIAVSQPMRCAARELAGFLHAHGAGPPTLLENHLMGRCGATGTRTATSWVAGDVLPEQTDAEVLAAWRGEIEALIESGRTTGPQAAGIWFERRDDHAVVALVTAERRAHLEPMPFTPEAGGWARISGELLRPAEAISAFVTVGPLGYAQCEVDPEPVLPRFAIACPVDPDDAFAWISLAARAPGRVLFDGIADTLVLPRGGPATEWQRVDYGSSGSVGTPAELSERLLHEVNRIRGDADMQPLVLEALESQTARKLAPYYFASYYGTIDARYGDEAALGLLAGWQVPGMIRNGLLAGALARETQAMDDFLAEAFQGPDLRRVLLDPGMSRVAIGPLLSTQHRYVGAMVASWALYREEDPAVLRETFYRRLAREFQRRELPAPRRENSVEPLATQRAARLAAGAEGTRESLNTLLRDSAAALNVQVRGWMLEGDGLDQVVIPEELFDKPPARIAAAVGYYQPDGHPWGRTFVLLVTAPESRMRTAALERSR